MLRKKGNVTKKKDMKYSKRKWVGGVEFYIRWPRKVTGKQLLLSKGFRKVRTLL